MSHEPPQAPQARPSPKPGACRPKPPRLPYGSPTGMSARALAHALGKKWPNPPTR